MNTKIYFNNHKLLVDDGKSNLYDYSDWNNLNAEFPDKKFSSELIKELIKSKRPLNHKLICSNERIFLNEFKKHFHYIEAAGGLIQNGNSFLIIKRHGRWDLPKGKLELREKPEIAAIRECEEECRVKKLRIIRKLRPTYHIYPYLDSYALKKSHWYLMTTNFKGKLIPQKSENIELAVWMGRKKIKLEVLNDTYFTIQDVMNEGIVF